MDRANMIFLTNNNFERIKFHLTSIILMHPTITILNYKKNCQNQNSDKNHQFIEFNNVKEFQCNF